MSRSSTADAYSVTIVCPMVPSSWNQMKRRAFNHFVYAECRNAWQRTIFALIQGRDKEWLTSMAQAKKKMRVEITVRHMRFYDSDNVGVKPIYDSLKRLGFLYDDRDEFCDKVRPVQEKTRDNDTRIFICESAAG